MAIERSANQDQIPSATELDPSFHASWADKEGSNLNYFLGAAEGGNVKRFVEIIKYYYVRLLIVYRYTKGDRLVGGTLSR